MRHIYVCQYWNTTNENVDYNLIFSDNIKQRKKVYNRFVLSYKNRDNYITEKEENEKTEDIITHVISNRDPLFSVIGHSNGNKTLKNRFQSQFYLITTSAGKNDLI